MLVRSDPSNEGAGYLPLLPLFEPAFGLGLRSAFVADGGDFAGRSFRAGACLTGLGFVAAPARSEDAFPAREVVAGFSCASPGPGPTPCPARPFVPAVADLPRLVDDGFVRSRTCPGAGPPRARPWPGAVAFPTAFPFETSRPGATALLPRLTSAGLVARALLGRDLGRPTIPPPVATVAAVTTAAAFSATPPARMPPPVAAPAVPDVAAAAVAPAAVALAAGSVAAVAEPSEVP